MVITITVSPNTMTCPTVRPPEEDCGVVVAFLVPSTLVACCFKLSKSSVWVIKRCAAV